MRQDVQEGGGISVQDRTARKTGTPVSDAQKQEMMKKAQAASGSRP